MNELLPGKEPLLIPTPSLTSDEFEDFTERLLNAQRFCPDSARRVVRVQRWGRKGDSQDGIDFEGTFSDGKTAAWQCKRYDKLTTSDVKEIVKKCTFEADEYYIVFSGEASRDARDETANHENWELLDRRALGRMVDDLPLHKRRQVLDETWGVQKRKLLLEVPGEDAFLSLDNFARERKDPETPLNDCGPMIGRDVELATLAKGLDRNSDWPPIILVTGPGGRGKTRHALEALAVLEYEHPTVPVICLADGRTVDADALRELPHVPAIVMVDDVHRDPAAIAPLLDYVRRATGTQLVLTSRSTGRDLVRAEIIRKGFRLDQVLEVVVGELSLSHARHLVSSLTAGLELSPAFSEYLALQAVDSPHIAVLAVNLIRRGELVGALKLDAGFREQVLLRYQEVLAGKVDDFDGDTVRSVLALLAAIGPLNVAEDLAADIAEFCGLKLPAYLRLLERLHERGLLVTRTGNTRVTPDILADQILERESAIFGQSTGFTTRVWDAFRGMRRGRLVVTLSELDWRLVNQGGPSIIEPVWSGLREELARLSLGELRDAIGELEPLGYTQPRVLFQLLEQVRGAMAAPSHDADVDGEDALRAALNLPPLTIKDVIELLPRQYASCAENAPDLLEPVLDALWAVRREDSREPHQYPDHPVRVIEDRLGNLGELPDPTFPARIVARVDYWLRSRSDHEELVTPLFALKPLLLKEGKRFVAKNRREISIRNFYVVPEKVRSVRDSIRQLLLSEIAGSDLPCAGQAVELLGVALQSPMGIRSGEPEGANPTPWESDDLTTLAVLAEDAGATGSAVVRRLIRREVEWSAAYSLSARVRHSALTLITKLDDEPDDLAELLLDNHGQSPSRRGEEVPSLAGVEAEVRDEARTNSSTEAAPADYPKLMARAGFLLDRESSEREERLSSVAHNLFSGSNLYDDLVALEEEVRQVRLATRDPQAARGLGSLFQTVALLRPDRMPELVQSASGHTDGPLDDELHLLIAAWSKYGEESLLLWLRQLPTYRDGIRLAIARAFEINGWADHPRFSEVYWVGVKDDTAEIRNRFLAASHRLLSAEPATTAELLIKSDASPRTVVQALEMAAKYDGLGWGQTLAEVDAQSVLELLPRAGWSSRVVQQICSGIAVRHPRLVLQYLVSQQSAGASLPTEISGLAAAFDARASELIGWMVECSRLPDRRSPCLVTSLALNKGLTDSQAAALIAAVESLEGPEIVGIVDLLRGVATWPLKQAGLARRLLARADHEGAGRTDEILRELRRGMGVIFWTYSNGVSPELEEAYTRARALAEAEPRPDLKNAFSEAAEAIARDRDRTRRDYEEDED